MEPLQASHDLTRAPSFSRFLRKGLEPTAIDEPPAKQKRHPVDNLLKLIILLKDRHAGISKMSCLSRVQITAAANRLTRYTRVSGANLPLFSNPAFFPTQITSRSCGSSPRIPHPVKHPFATRSQNRMILHPLGPFHKMQNLSPNHLPLIQME
jgi:hypothetical protein